MPVGERRGGRQGHPQRCDGAAGAIVSTLNPTSSHSSALRLTRSATDRKVGGVAGGLAEYLDADPLAVRLAFAVGSLFSGAGLLAYILMLAFVPEQDAPAVAPRPVAA